MQNRSRTLVNNSVALFVRMLIRTGINLYTMRVILQVLGVEDYGIYSVVAGFVLMFGFFNSTMSGAMSRFFSYNLGQEDFNGLHRSFRASITIQLIISVGIVLITETIGLIIVNHLLVIPTNRIVAANIVYQCAILGMVFTILQVPYNAMIIAYERMNIYAVIEILNALLLLLIVYIVEIFPYDKLIAYGILYVIIYFSTMILYIVYCNKKIGICDFKLNTKRQDIIPLLSFSGWDMFSNVGQSTQMQANNVVINMFWGTVLNASIGIASHIYSAILMFAYSVTTAVRPQIIKFYAIRNMHQMLLLTQESSRYILLISTALSVPLIVEMDYILKIWLGEVPKMAVEFAQIVLINHSISASKSILIIPIHATGEIRNFSIKMGLMYIFAIPLAYLLAKFNFSPLIVFGIVIVLSLGNIALELNYLFSHFSLFSIRDYVVKLMIPNSILLVMCTLLGLFIKGYIEDGFMCFIIMLCGTFIITVILGYLLLLDKESRKFLLSFIKEFFQKVGCII